MGSLNGFQEFYVTCNPPLLPHGVDHVIEATCEAHSEHVIEMLYEPEIPWFKIIAETQYQRPITDFVQSLLLEIIEADSELLSHDQESAYVGLDAVDHHVRVLPWSELQHDISARNFLYNRHRFPEDMQSLAQKTVWRGLDAHIGWTLEVLLALVKSRWKDMGAPSCIQHLSQRLGCTITHNLRGTLVYLGTNGSAATLEAALKTLDNLLRLAVYASRSLNQPDPRLIVEYGDDLRLCRSEHLLLPEGPGPFRFIFSWLSHLGLDSMTYLLGTREQTEKEYKKMAHSATVRAERKTENKEWMPDYSHYPNTGLLTSTGSKAFSPFENYPYEKKESEKVLALFELIESAVQKQLVERLDDGPENSTVDMDDNQASEPCSSGGRHAQSVDSNVPTNFNHLLDERNDDLLAKNTLVNKAGPPQKSVGVQGVEEDLMSFEDAQDSSLIDFRPESQTETSLGLVSWMRAPEPVDLLTRSPPEKNKKKAREDRSSQQVFFELEGDRPKEIRRTMNQRAGQPSYGGQYRSEYPPLPQAQSHRLGEASGLASAGQRSTAEASTLRPTAPPFSAWNTALPFVGAAGRPSPLLKQRDDTKGATGSRDGPNIGQKILQSRELAGTKDEKAVDVTHLKSAEQPLVRPPSAMMALLGPQKNFARNSVRLEMTKAKVKDLSSILHLMPGLVSLDIKFGRIYLKNMDVQLVSTGSDPYLTEAEMMEKLLADGAQPDRFAFSTVLSVAGSDANTLAETHPDDAARWQLVDKVVWHEFECVSEEHGAFLVDMDAKTFKLRVRGEAQEVGTLSLHCVQRPWDMQVCVSHAPVLDESPVHAAIANALASSVSIRTDKTGELAMETTTDARLQASIESIHVRHVARYKSKARTGSMLSITMTKRLERGAKQERRVKWCAVPSTGRITGSPPVWYEACISSARGRELLAENVGLKLGEQASYDGNVLDKEGVFEDMCRPALHMIAQMEEVGTLNDNGHGVKRPFRSRERAAESRATTGGDGKKYW